MSTFDLTESFVSLLTLQDEQHPEFRLAQNLGKVNVVLTGFAESLWLERDEVSALHVCTDCEHLHPALLKYIDSLPQDEAYKGQNVSRLKKLVRNLPWSGRRNDSDSSRQLLLDEQLPSYFKEVWFLLPRIPHGRGTASKEVVEYPSNGDRPPSLPLSPVSVSLVLTLLRVSKAFEVPDTQTLLEDYSAHIYKDIRHNNPHRRWVALNGAFCDFRVSVRQFLEYEPEKRPTTSFELQNLPEPLRTQVLFYKETAEHGFEAGHPTKKLGRTKYALEFDKQSSASIESHIERICLGIGYVPLHMYRDSLDIKDLMRLEGREIVVDETKTTEQFNPLVDVYRQRELCRSSDYKEADFDSRSFALFLDSIATVAAYNGIFHLRRLFLEAYKVNPDTVTPENRKKAMRRTYTREWADLQIANLKIKFDRIVKEGTFHSRSDGRMTKEARKNLNLCLFYVTLLTLRLFGLRQRNIRESVSGINVIVGRRGRVTFQWVEGEMKNKKGLTHRMNIDDHGGTHANLIEAVWKYDRHIYPVISGARGGEESLRKKRRQAIGGRFYIKLCRGGLCVPFKNHRDFGGWFYRQCLTFLDYDGLLKDNSCPPSAHFYRALFGNWTRHDLGCQSEVSAALAADTEEIYERFYIEQPTTFDATDTWTEINQRMKDKHQSQSRSRDKRLEFTGQNNLENVVISQAEEIERLKAQLKKTRGKKRRE